MSKLLRVNTLMSVWGGEVGGNRWQGLVPELAARFHGRRREDKMRDGERQREMERE